MKFHIQTAIRMMQNIASIRDLANFSGLGVIFYASIEELPVIALGDVSRFSHSLPVSGKAGAIQIPNL